MSELSVILINHNDKNNLGRCLCSLAETLAGMDFETIVVDNNSNDGSPEFIEERFPWVRLIRNSENVGFSKANNQAVRAGGGEFILFLNTDTVVCPGAVDGLLREMKSDGRVGAIGPALLHGENTYQVSFGKSVGFFREIIQKCLLNPYYRMTLKIDRRKREAGWLSAACLLARRKAVEEAGFFDERFFLYFEDIDLCLRMRKAGWKLLYFPGAKIYHKGGAVTSTFGFLSRKEYRKSQLYFYGKHNSRMSLSLLRLYLRAAFVFSCFRNWKDKRRRAVIREVYHELLKADREKG